MESESREGPDDRQSSRKDLSGFAKAYCHRARDCSAVSR
jgi:hypothetical protein